MSSEAEIASAVDALYGAAIGETPWDGALDQVLRATGFEGAFLYVWDRRQMSIRRAAAIDRQSHAPIEGQWHRLDPALRVDYERHFFKLDPRVRYSWRNPGRRIVYDHLHTSEAAIDRDEYYQWFERQTGMRYSVGGATRRNLAFGGALSLHRDRRRGHPEPAEIARFAALFDHVERALAVGHRLGARQGSDAGPGDLLDGNPTGIVLLDRHGITLYANRAARAIAARADALAIDRAGLRALRPCDDAPLQALIGQAAAGDIAAPRGDAMRLPRSTGKRDYLVMVTPVPRRGGVFAFAAAAACVMLSDPDRAPEVPAAALRRLYNLTPGEIRLVERLLLGETPERAAAALGIRIATVRSALASIFRKTETSRQSELVRLLASTPWWATGGGDRP